MSAPGVSPQTAIKSSRGGLALAIRSEWTKFRTVRGWLISLAVAAVLFVAFTYLVANGQHQDSCTSNGECTSGHPFVPTGPDGEAVADSYQFVEQPLTGNTTVTARVISLSGLTWAGPSNEAPSLASTRPGLAGWAKAGLLLTPSTKPGSSYAAVMATGGHGVRFQYDYTHDRAGLPGTVSDASPRWLRLTRAGDTITSYDSTNGTTWNEIGSSRLAGLPATVSVGLFVTSPVSFHGESSETATQATATFDHLDVNGHVASNAWQAKSVGMSHNDFYTTLGTGGYHRTRNAFVVSGSGDIAPAVGAPFVGGSTAYESLLFGLNVALIILIVVATMFITAEYRSGLIDTTFTAIPRRGRVLMAKAAVVGVVAFVTGAVSAAIGIPLAEHLLNTNGDYLFPTSTLTELRVILGTGAVAALAAVGVLAIGTVARRSAAAVTAGIVVFVLPYIVDTFLSGDAREWLFRLTPAAAFSVLGALPRSALVSAPYTMSNGYYPLAPWAGLAVLCVYAVAALGLATFVLKRRDA
jgi:ABC-type transport system involved in multi-copper enzyme maturation permease subunit